MAIIVMHNFGMIRLPILIVSGAIGITVAIVSYYYFMPYWIIVERVPSSEVVAAVTDRIPIAVSDKELDENPSLRQAINSVEQKYQAHMNRIATTAVKTSSLSEGERIMDLLKGERLYYTKDANVDLRYQGNEYAVWMQRSYYRPALIE